MADEVNDMLEGGGPPAVKLEKVGDSIVGTVVDAVVRQEREPNGKPKYYDDGNERKEIVITMATDERDDDVEDDDGTRRWFCRGISIKRLREARQNADGLKIEPGVKVAIVRVDDIAPKVKGHSPTFDYDVKVKAADKSAAVNDATSSDGKPSADSLL